MKRSILGLVVFSAAGLASGSMTYADESKDPIRVIQNNWTSQLVLSTVVGEVLKVIRDLAQEGRTMILVTHEMAFARDVSSRVMFLHQGLVEEQGPPKQVFGEARSERLRQFLARMH